MPFAGYEMPVHYPLGVLKEHVWTREQAGLFDVSHMGQCFVIGPNHAATAAALEALMPADISGLAPGHIRYSQLTTADGGIIDDLMVTRSLAALDDGALGIVVNASRKGVDYPHIAAHLPVGVRLQRADDRALLALQGPAAAAVLGALAPKAIELGFMMAIRSAIDGIECGIARSGYTGEDGFEISVSAERASDLARALLANPAVKPIGLGARDSLRLEAGLCLYGHDIDETTSPVEAGLVWSIGKRRRAEGGFPGAERIQRELAMGPARKRVGIVPEGRAPAREGAEIQDVNGRRIGVVTSGGFGPSLNGPLAMGYVETASATVGTAVQLIVRDRPMPARITPMPFVANRYFRTIKA